MSARIFPVTIDNTYRGHRLGLWLLAAVVAVKVVQILSVMIDGPGIVQSADGIPLDTFPAAAAQTVVAAFIGMGISRLLLCAICAIALRRYRSVVPFLFALLAVHDVVRELALHAVRTGTPVGPFVNIALIVVTIIGIGFAVPRRGTRAHEQPVVG